MQTARPLRAKSCFGCWLCRWRWARAVFSFGLYFLSGGNLQPERNMQLHLPDYFVADLISTVAFGLIAILLVVVGYKVFDKLTPKLDFDDLLNKGNVPWRLSSAVSF